METQLKDIAEQFTDELRSDSSMLYEIGQGIDRLKEEREALLVAAKDFVEKVESGRARSVDSYAKFKAAIAKAEGTTP